MMTGIPSPSLNTLPWPNFADNRGRLYLFRIVLITALKANCPRQRIVFRSLSESISLARYAEQFVVSSVDGLLSGRSEERRVGKECRVRWWWWSVVTVVC